MSLLEIRDYRLAFDTFDGTLHVLDGIDLSLEAGATLGIPFVLAQPGGIAAAVTVYGAPLFYFSQAMRIAGCVAGAMHEQRRRRLAP